MARLPYEPTRVCSGRAITRLFHQSVVRVLIPGICRLLHTSYGGNIMKVFLSWSGRKSREIATAFHDWLPYVIQTVKPFISTGDIDKGKRWSEVLASELDEVAYGIIFITQDNFKEPWINFEAGAISKAINVSYVSPFLFDVVPSRILGPLQQFQFTVNDREDIFNLLRSINNRLGDEQQLTYEIL